MGSQPYDEKLNNMMKKQAAAIFVRKLDKF